MTSTFKTLPRHLAAALCGALLLLGAAHAARVQDDRLEPTADAEGTISKKIGHRLADWVQTASPFETLGHAPRRGAPIAGSLAAASSPIAYHPNSSIMPSVSKIVVIWYGNWNQGNSSDTPAGQQIIMDALYGMSVGGSTIASNYVGITTADGSSLGNYSQSDTKAVSAISSPNITTFTQPASSTYGGTRLTDANVAKLVKAYAGSNPDTSAIHLVLSSSEISESSGFLTKYCGWHTYYTATSGAVKYAFIGNPRRSLSACAAQTAASPNGNPGVDAMVSVIAHELMETVTDPQLNAWYNGSGSENADMCAWTFGSSQTLLNNGAYYNVTLPAIAGGNRNYLLQRALASSDSRCYINANGKLQ